ncbi:HU family DNA-binding protein [Mycoplasmopsis agassizii]|uniref:HU family DNA-binding protein n=1 Tax=Mycoplasmopsis agassizii TaxID=33922 RepID=A0A1W1WXN0_9BACT|nr:HU family DNA-binding protein [Mycoplasmopsis agassizii]PAF54622.1 HU family DNA-binding protein [Mycoplasmopsis agassizii]PAK21075.1 HU family DNA-binding protein [Mycoplasmopsis agassizii]SMC16340.1 DNA-binding protein HU-beta [Mycoplasmopsis agassizii]
MTKKELIEKITSHSGLDKGTVNQVLESAWFIIREGLIQEEKIPLGPLGSVSVKVRAEKTSHHPITKEVISVAAKRVVKFSPSKHIKEVVDF